MPVASPARTFDFAADTFAYPNELVWEYHFDPQTSATFTRRRNPPPTYAHHCFVVARSARQFFLHAAFQPHLPAPGEAQLAERVRSVVRRSPQHASPAAQRIAFPGFASLRELSETSPEVLKAACGGAWQSYVQRGNWRMVLPFSRAHQLGAAGSFVQRIGQLPIVHIATFPSLTINHALLLFGQRSTVDGFAFDAYDPNNAAEPMTLLFDGSRRSFLYPRTNYFPGGPVNAYEIYCGWSY